MQRGNSSFVVDNICGEEPWKRKLAVWSSEPQKPEKNQTAEVKRVRRRHELMISHSNMVVQV